MEETSEGAGMDVSPEAKHDPSEVGVHAM